MGFRVVQITTNEQTAERGGGGNSVLDTWRFPWQSGVRSTMPYCGATASSMEAPSDSIHPSLSVSQTVTWKKGVSFCHGWSQQSPMGLNGSGRAPRMWHKPLGILLVFFLVASIFLLKGQQWTSLLRDFSHHHGGSAFSVNFFHRLPTLPSILLYLQSFLVPIYEELKAADRDVSWDARSLAFWGNSRST